MTAARPDASERDLVVVVDLGAQYAQLIARRVREAHVYSEIVPRTMPFAEMLAKGPKAIILSGGPASVHVEGAPSVDPALYESGLPIFGICYGAQLLARDLGGEVAKTGRGEYGRTDLSVADARPLFREQPAAQPLWMSHFDTLTVPPAGATVLASTPDPRCISGRFKCRRPSSARGSSRRTRCRSARAFGRSRASTSTRRGSRRRSQAPGRRRSRRHGRQWPENRSCWALGRRRRATP